MPLKEHSSEEKKCPAILRRAISRLEIVCVARTESAADEIVGDHTLSRVPGIDDQFRAFHDVLVVIRGVIGHYQHAVEALELR